MKNLLIISGPTATGKTSLAFNLAKKFDGELISADSRQVYKGMDVVTGKDLDKEVKTWLLDVAEPNQPFTGADYQRLAWQAIEDIWKREKLPIIVGGTGFYIKALLDGIGTMGVKPDYKLREELNLLTVYELGKRLAKADSKRWERMNESDRKNPRRLIRAIEIAMDKHNSGHYFTRQHKSSKNITPVKGKQNQLYIHLNTVLYLSNIDFLWVGLKADFKTLYKKIDKRVDERLQMGAVEETKQLAKKYGWDIPSMTGQGYRELRGFVEGEITLDKAAARWTFAEHEYARKQMTWFKKDKRIVWVDISAKDFKSKVEQLVEQWYTR